MGLKSQSSFASCPSSFPTARRGWTLQPELAREGCPLLGPGELDTVSPSTLWPRPSLLRLFTTTCFNNHLGREPAARSQCRCPGAAAGGALGTPVLGSPQPPRRSAMGCYHHYPALAQTAGCSVPDRTPRRHQHFAKHEENPKASFPFSFKRNKNGSPCGTRKYGHARTCAASGLEQWQCSPGHSRRPSPRLSPTMGSATSTDLPMVGSAQALMGGPPWQPCLVAPVGATGVPLSGRPETLQLRCHHP